MKLIDLLNTLNSCSISYKKLEKLCDCSKGEQLNKEKLLKDGLYSVINGGINPSGFWNNFNTPKNTITISQGGESAGFVCYQKQDFWAGAHCYVLKQKSQEINYKYLYYFLKDYEETLRRAKVGAGIPSLAKNSLCNVIVSVPSLSVQEKIVSFLDLFTELNTELNTEYTKRKKQYEWYLNNLLDFESGKNKLKKFIDEFCPDGVQYKTINELFECKAGGDLPKYSFSKFQTDEYKIPVISNGTKDKSIFGFTDIAKITKPSITISSRGSIGYVQEINYPFYPIVRLICLTPKNSGINLSFAKYILSLFEFEGTQSCISQITIPYVKDITIPLPPLEIQQKIVDILDKFNTLANDLSIGLPKEIELDNKRYKYYRNMIFNALLPSDKNH